MKYRLVGAADCGSPSGRRRSVRVARLEHGGLDLGAYGVVAFCFAGAA